MTLAVRVPKFSEVWSTAVWCTYDRRRIEGIIRDSKNTKVCKTRTPAGHRILEVRTR